MCRSLLWLLDHTRTPCGARLLRSWVAHPLRDAVLIGERLDAVQELLAAGRCQCCRELMTQVYLLGLGHLDAVQDLLAAGGCWYCQ